MNITDCFKVRRFVLAVLLSTGLSFGTPSFGQSVTSWVIDSDGKGLTRLGTLGGQYTNARDINDAGRVVGQSRTAGGLLHAFITGPHGVGMTDLGTFGGSDSFAFGVNAIGQVVGDSATAQGPRLPFITGPNGVGMTALGTLGGGSDSVAYGINDTGQVVGQFDGQAFFTGPGGAGITGFGVGSIWAFDINNAGQVVFAKNGGIHHAFITGPNGVGETDLGALRDTSTPLGINAAGRVVGYSQNDFDDTHDAFITGPNGVGMTSLGTLGGNDSIANDINDAGQVVGYATTVEGERHAFITGPNGVGMTDLNSLVSLPPGVVLTQAYGINNLGQVVVVGTIPEPASYALMLAGLGLVGFMVRSKRFGAGSVGRSA